MHGTYSDVFCSISLKKSTWKYNKTRSPFRSRKAARPGQARPAGSRRTPSIYVYYVYLWLKALYKWQLHVISEALWARQMINYSLMNSYAWHSSQSGGSERTEAHDDISFLPVTDSSKGQMEQTKRKEKDDIRMPTLVALCALDCKSRSSSSSCKHLFCRTRTRACTHWQEQKIVKSILFYYL